MHTTRRFCTERDSQVLLRVRQGIAAVSITIRLVREGQSADTAAAARVLADAYVAGPVAHWFDAVPDAVRAHGGAYYAGVVGHALATGTVYVAEDQDGRAIGAAAWRHRTAGTDLDGTGRRDRRGGGSVVDQIGDLDSLLRRSRPRDAGYHHLACVGVRPDLQNQSVGRDLILSHLDTLRPLGLPAYLEADTAGNHEFFLSVGFADCRTVVDLPRGLRVWPMQWTV
jgi:GNAT superfamily N-acetyltransferase